MERFLPTETLEELPYSRISDPLLLYYLCQKAGKLSEQKDNPQGFTLQLNSQASKTLSYASLFISSFTFIRRTMVLLSFSSNFIRMKRMVSSKSGMVRYSKAFTLLLVFSISLAISWHAFSTSASSSSLDIIP